MARTLPQEQFRLPSRCRYPAPNKKWLNLRHFPYVNRTSVPFPFLSANVPQHITVDLTKPQKTDEYYQSHKSSIVPFGRDFDFRLGISPTHWHCKNNINAPIHVAKSKPPPWRADRPSRSGQEPAFIKGLKSRPTSTFSVKSRPDPTSVAIAFHPSL
jgi:hypothetical protein